MSQGQICKLPFRALSFLLLLLAFTGCSSEVIRRDAVGQLTSPIVPLDSLNTVRNKVVLLNLFNESPYGGEDLAFTATQELVTELSRTGQFVFEMNAADSMGDSKSIYNGAGINLVQIGKKAKQLGVNFVFFGRITEARVRDRPDDVGLIRETKSFTESKIELKIFDVQQNKIIFNQLFHGYAADNSYNFYLADKEENILRRQDLLRYGVKVAVRRSIPTLLQLAGRWPWSGRVAKIAGDKIYINSGKNSGLQLGDILKVFSDGDEIYDPETGALMGQTKGEIKGNLEIIDFFGTDGAISILHSGGTVDEGDFVKLY